MKIGVSSMMVEVGSSFSENRKYFVHNDKI